MKPKEKKIWICRSFFDPSSTWWVFLEEPEYANDGWHTLYGPVTFDSYDIGFFGKLPNIGKNECLEFDLISWKVVCIWQGY